MNESSNDEEGSEGVSNDRDHSWDSSDQLSDSSD